MIVTNDTLADLLVKVEKLDKLAIDTETTGLHLFTKDVVCGVSIYHPDIGAYYFPIRHSSRDNLTTDNYHKLLSAVSNVTMIGHNTKFDRHGLTRDGALFSTKVIDTCSGAQLLNENQRLGLKPLADKYLDFGSSTSEKELYKNLDTWGFDKGEMWRLLPDVSAPYAEMDARLTWDLAEFLDKKLPSEVRPLWDEVNDYSELLRGMEECGILVDRAKIAELKNEAYMEAQALSDKLRKTLGRPINVLSPAQVARAFAIPDATEETLLTVKHLPGVDEVLRYKWFMAAITRYYNKYPGFMDANNTIHTDFNPTGTETGRLSSSNPNLTAIPRYSPEQRIKDLFIARPGRVYIEADYKQAEIRVAAHYTKDPAVLRIFEDDLDYHTETAKALGIDRQKAKVFNLALNYGAGVGALVKQIGIPEKQVKTVLKNYHEKFPGFRKTSKRFEEVADERGYIRYWTGRRRHFDGDSSESRKAFNSCVQGGTAEIVRRTMQRLVKDCPEFVMVLQVHDSLLGEVDERIAPEVAKKVKEIMEDQPYFSVKLPVDMKIGTRLSEMKEI
jgi:DNA polymerase I